MSRSLALLCAAATLVATHAQWKVKSVALTYVSGIIPDEVLASGGAGSAVSTAVWHDTVSAPLVLQLTLDRDTVPTGSTPNNLATPSSTWLKITSTNSPSTLASVVSVSAPVTNTELRYNVTLRNAYGAYTIAFDPTALVDSANVAGTNPDTLATSFVVLAGFAPAVTIVNNGATVTSQWLDPNSINNVLSIASGSATTGLATSGGVRAPASPCSTLTSTSASTCPQIPSSSATKDAIVFTYMAYTASAATYNMSLGDFNTPSSWLAGTYLLNLTQGFYQRSDGVFNYKVTVPVKVGWRPKLSFHDVANYLGVDDSSYPSSTQTYWFNSDLSQVQLRVASGKSGASGSSTDEYLSGTAPANLDLLLGVTAATRPGALARSGGIQSTGSSAIGPNVNYTLAITGLPPGTYTFSIPAGTLQSGGSGAYNCPVQATLRIGFVPRVRTLSRTYGTDVTGTWLDPTPSTYDSYSIALLPSVGFALAASTTYTNLLASQVFNTMPTSDSFTTSTVPSTDAIFADDANVLPVYTTTSATFNLTKLVSRATQSVNVSAAALMRSDGIMSTFTYTSLKVGFKPSLTFTDAYQRVSSFQFADPSNGGLLSANYVLTASSAVPTGAFFFSSKNNSVSFVVQDPSMSNITHAALPVTTSGGLFAGLTVRGFPAPAQAFGVPQKGLGFANYTLNIGSTAPGTYAVPIAPGAVCNADSICNAPSIGQLFVGYDIQPRLSSTFSTSNGVIGGATSTTIGVIGGTGSAYAEYLPDGTPVEFDRFSLDIAPGPGFYFVSATAATAPTPSYVSFPACTSFDIAAPSNASFTYAYSYGGIDSVILKPSTCASKYGSYLFRIASGQLQRDDGVYNAPLEYPITLGFPVTAAIDVPSATLSPGSTHGLSITASPDAISGIAGFKYFGAADAAAVTAAAPLYSTLFAGQAATPAHGFVTGQKSSIASSTAVNYDLAFSPSIAYGNYSVRISAGAISATGTDGNTYYSAASWSSFSVGYVSTLAVVNSVGVDVTSSFYTAGADALVAQENLFLRFTVSDPVLAQQLALNDFSSMTFASAVVVNGATGAIAHPSTTNPLYTGPILRSSASGLTITYQIAGAAWSIVKDYTGLQQLAIAAGKFCTPSWEFCNAAVNTSSAITSSSISIKAAGVMTGAITLPSPNTPAEIITGTSAANLRGWLSGSTKLTEVPTHVPIGTWAAIVYAVFTFDAAHGYTSLPLMAHSNAITVTFSSAPTTDTLILAVNLGSAPQGAYDITITPKADALKTHAPVSVRVIKGFQARAFTMDTNAPVGMRGDALVIAASDISLGFLGLSLPSAAKAFGSVLTSAVDAKGRDVSGVITCGIVDTNQPISCANAQPGGSLMGLSSHYRVNVGGLSDGTYTLGLTGDKTIVTDSVGTAPVTNATATIIIDRTPPRAIPTIASLTITAGAFNQSLRIPAGMFSDAISPASALTISLVNPVPNWGLFDGRSGIATSGPASSVVLTTGAFSPAPSDTPIVFLLQAQDEAGNVAQAPLSLTIVAPVTAALTVVDSRGASGTPLSPLVSAPAADGSVTYTVNAVFGTAVGPINPASLGCRITSVGFYATGTTNALSLSGAPCNAVVTVSPGDGVTLSRRFVFTVVIPAASVRAVANSGPNTGFQFSLQQVGVASASGVRAAPALPVLATIDSRAPFFGQGSSASWCYAATVGVTYSQPLTLSLFGDAMSTPNKITVTAASPASQFGLTFVPGLLGTGAKITGKATAVPPSGAVYFDLTVVDAAGNSAVHKSALMVPIVAALSPANPTFTMKTTPLTFTKALEPTATSVVQLVDPQAAVGGLATGLSTGQIFVQLQTPDTPSAGCGKVSPAAPVATTIASGECSEYVYSTSTDFVNDPTTRFVQSTYYDINSGYVETILSSPYVESSGTYTVGSLTQSSINSFLSTLTYVNKGLNITAGPRVVSVFLLASNNGPIVASASRTINVVTVNSVPTVVAGDATAAVTYGATVVPGTGGGQPYTIGLEASPQPLFGANSLSGKAGLNLGDSDDSAFTAASITITACDAARDVLFVQNKTSSDFTDRQINTATNTWALQRAVYGTWVPSTCTLVIKPVAGNSAPASAFTAALSGVSFTSKDPKNPTGFATPASATAAVLTATRAFTVMVTDAAAGGRASAPATSNTLSGLSFTISAANRDAVINRRLMYAVLSSTSPLANAYRSAVDAAGVIPYSKIFVDNSKSDATLTINVSAAFASGAITDADTSSILTPFVTSSDSAKMNVKTNSFASGILTVTLDGFAATPVGEYTLNFNYPTYLGGSSTPVQLPFVVDLRKPGCTLSNAANYVTDALLATTLPANDQCTFAPVTVTASSTPGTVTTVAVGTYVATNALLSNAAAQLASLNIPLAQQVTALAAQRNAARGASSVAIDPSSIIGAGSLAITTAMASAATAALLPTPTSNAVVDTSLVLLLGPAGTQFSAPVQVCMFVGDTPSTSYRVLYVSSQLDDTNAAKGYGPLTALSNQVFNPATGQLCGDTTHFSAFVPGTLPLPTVPTVPKSLGMGGACPNQCSGQGYCRKEGKCACFPGFLGYDCSARACPSGASWGQGSGGGAGLTAVAVDGNAGLLAASVHTDAECSGRGVCDRAKAACKCYAGYEGPACQRIACPNACSGHGKCRFLSELPSVAASGAVNTYNSWEAQRVQKCVCDGGWQGADCSQRTCPYGDDPETICSDATRQVQRVALYFGAGPGAASSLPTGATTADLSASALALRFQAVDGTLYTTPAINSVWGTDATSAGAAATNVANALTSLPSGAVSGVSVSFDISAAASRSFDVTFTGPTNTGNEALMSCAFNSDGASMGCTTAGCRPLFAQPRLLNVISSVAITGSLSVNAGAILMQPSAIAGGNSAQAAAAAGSWGVETTLTLTAAGTYSWGSTKVYGSATGAPEPVTPLPPQALRTGVQGPYGLLVDLSADLSALFTASSSVAVTFKWSLPSCAVTQVAAAAADYEKAECSNRGVCDRTAGKCTCFTGYSGSACNAQVMYV